jgi:hypothetical protein
VVTETPLAILDFALRAFGGFWILDILDEVGFSLLVPTLRVTLCVGTRREISNL